MRSPGCKLGLRAWTGQTPGKSPLDHPRRQGGWWWLVAVGLLLGPGAPGRAEKVVTDSPYKIKAAYLYNYTRYVAWPGTAFADAQSAWHIGILGEDPFGQFIDKMFRDRRSRDRGFVFHRARRPDALPFCHMVYVAVADDAQRREVLRSLGDKPVLTIGEAPEFLQEGGIVRFRFREESVIMDLNLDQALKAGLHIDAKLLEVAYEVIEKGKVRQRK